ncbi:hypothetical protein BXY75_0041 [Ulvibacter antarcticus]|uniref:Uncharacterized protein n=1 Tax=Ulvibacter antarcticus TaxID=442714 RepID=A0A3L9ZB64_9FLAO|nr:hypothetical protein BXY75_0041 [Ulvibacter antarcticus]
MKHSIKESVGIYFEKINSGSMEISDLRKALESDNLEKHEIDIIVKRVDRDLMRMEVQKQNYSYGKCCFLEV